MRFRGFGARLGVLSATAALAIAVAGLSAAPAAAHGCSPGFWKNKGAPLAATVDVKVNTVFTGFVSSIGNLKLSQALSLQGGSTLADKQEILARAAAAAYFNRKVTGVYPVTLAGLKTMVNNALATNNKGTITFVAADIDWWNNLGNPDYCKK